MSRDLYPSNSNIIDLRSKILPTQAPLKTKQFINELDRLSSTPLGQKERNLSSGITYENERWFSPRFNADMNISLPPRRSIFTPSRLSSRRIRESTKPYWRCPQPVSTSSTSTWYNTTIASMGKSSDNSSSVGNAATSINKSLSLDKPVSVCNVLSMDNMGVITSVNNTVTTFTDNAPSVGYITPVEDKGIDNAIDQEDEIAIVSTAADVQPAFTFADSIIRNPKCPTPPKPKPIYHDKEVQTDVVQTVNGSLQNSIANNIVDKMPVVAKLFEEPPTKQNLFDSVVTAPLSAVPLTTASAVSVPSAPVANVFQPPLAPLNGGSIQFGTSSLSHASNDSSMAVEPSTQQNSTCVPLFGVGLTTNGVSVNNAVFAPVISSAPFSGGFQFNPNPINGGVFQFSSSTSEVSNGSTFTNGLATRSSVLTRKVLHAKRSRKH